MDMVCVQQQCAVCSTQLSALVPRSMGTPIILDGIISRLVGADTE